MYETSFWSGTGKVYGHRTWEVLEQGQQGGRSLPKVVFDLPKEVRRHNYAPKWFAYTVGKPELGYGYSMKIPNDVRRSGWTGTIVGPTL